MRTMSVKSVLEGIKPDEKLIQDTERLLRSKIIKKKPRGNSFIAAAAYLSIIIVASSLSFYVYKQPVSYISFDVNPSLELEINRLDRVVEVNYFNEDARNMVSEKELYFLKPGEAIELIMNEADQQGYLSGNTSSIITIATNSNKEDRSIKLLEELLKKIENYSKPLNILSYSVSGSLKEEADTLSLSFGKLQLIKLIQQLDKAATVEGFKNASIMSIMNQISYLISDEYNDVDEATKERMKEYINSIQTKIGPSIKTSNQTDTKAQTDVIATTEHGAKEAEKIEKAQTTVAANAIVEEEKAQAEAGATASRAAAEAEKEKAEADAATARAAAEAEKEKAEADAATARAAAEAEKAKAEADAEAARAAAEVEKAKAEADAIAAQAAAATEKAKAEADAIAAQAAVEAEKAKAEADAAAAQAAAAAEKAKAEAEAEAEIVK